MLREKTNVIKIRDKLMGGNNPILIQTMAKRKTSDKAYIIALAKDLEKRGCDLLRVSVLDDEDVLALPEIIDNSPIPIIADLHFEKDLALKAIKSGVDKIRINPGNFHREDLYEIITTAKRFNTPIRIGINSGSILRTDIPINERQNKFFALLDDTLSIFKELDYTQNLVLSLKSSDPIITTKLYQAASELFPYPLHLGVTETGFGVAGMSRTSAALVPLLTLGIGNTIRISLGDDEKTEVEACKSLLKALNLKDDVPTLISCPTCGRTQCDVHNLVRKVSDLLAYKQKDVKVAIMGCPVNGPGEAKEADFGVSGGKNAYVAFINGKPIKNLSEDEAYNWLKFKIDTF